MVQDYDNNEFPQDLQQSSVPEIRASDVVAMFQGMLATFAKTPGNAVFMTDAVGRYVFLDGSGLASLGIVPERWLGRSVFEFLKDHPDHRRIIERVFQGETIIDQSRFDDHFFEDRFFPIAAPNGRLFGIAGIQVDVTDKVTAQKDLQKSIDLVDNLFDSIPDNAYLLDRDFTILRINAAARRMVPKVASQIGKPCYQAVHGRETPCEFCPATETLRTGQPTTREYFEEKVRRFFELTSFPIRDRKTGQIIGATEFARDITDRKQMEESLRRNQALLDDLMEVLDQGVYMIDTGYTITRANKAMQAMYPHLDPLVGKKCYDTTIYGGVCPDCAAECMFREGRPTTRTFFEKKSDGESGQWLELTAFPLYGFGSNGVTGGICILRDVTPRVEMESRLDEYRRQIRAMADKQVHELQLSEAKLRTILETSGAAISFADSRGCYTYINGKYKEMFGYSQEELLGKPLVSVTSSDQESWERGRALIEQALNGEIDAYRITLELETKNGRSLWADISVNAVRGLEPEETQLISVILDVTAQRQLVDQLERAKIAAEDASQAKSQFLATMSHEIRTPLNGVIGVSNLLMGTSLQPKQLEYAKLILASGESLLFLINDILDFSKIEAGKFELVETEFILHDLIESVLGILASRAEEKSLDLVATFDSRIPGPIIGDPGRLRQVLINLAGNALKFTETGGVRIHVELDAQLEKELRLRFEIIDTGIGIPEDRRDRLFRQFSQVDSSSSRAYGGTGLGLAISKRLVELMGGDIHVASIVGSGSTFGFTVTFRCAALVLKCLRAAEYPCITEKRDYCRGVPPTRCARSGREVAYLQHVVELKGLKTLFVGTGTVMIPALVDQLHAWGMQVETTTFPKEAFSWLQQATKEKDPFRLVVVDVRSQDQEAELFMRLIQDDNNLRKTAIIGLVSLADDLYQYPWPHPESIRFVTRPVCGSILLDSIVRLFFVLPDPSGFHRPENVRRSPGKVSDAVKPLRVLVAEDNRINQIVITEILHNAGMIATLAANGKEAFEKSQAESFDVILMDCQMPVMDGYVATGKIRQREAEKGVPMLPIIALTANVTSEDEAKCLHAGMNAYCSKPVNTPELLDKIRHWTTVEQ